MPSPRPLLDWNDVAILTAIAEAGSLSRAAKALKLSVATVSRRLDVLEQTVGQELFERLPNQLAITSAGEALRDQALAVRDAIDGFQRVADALDPDLGHVRITATQSISLYLVARLSKLQALVNAQAPAITLEIDATRKPLSLARREAHVAIRMRHPPDSGDLVVRKLGVSALTLYATQDVAQRATRDGDLITGVPIIGSLRSPDRSEQERWLRRVALADASILRISETALRRDAALRGLGAALLPCVVGDETPGLVRLVEPARELDEDAFLLLHRDLKDNTSIRRVVDAIVAVFKVDADALQGERR